jgi:hypothetical protein
MPVAVWCLNNFKHLIRNAVSSIIFYDKGMEFTLFLSAKNTVSYYNIRFENV